MARSATSFDMITAMQRSIDRSEPAGFTRRGRDRFSIAVSAPKRIAVGRWILATERRSVAVVGGVLGQDPNVHGATFDPNLARLKLF